MMDIESTDVLVVGLGPAGASAAAEAARRGCKVIAVDRRHEPGQPVQCAEFVPAMVGIDVDRVAFAVRQEIVAMTTFVEDDAPSVKEQFPGHMLDRAAFDAALVAKAVHAGAHCVSAVTVRRITSTGRVHLSDGRSIAARVIVGADGPRSITGRAIGQINSEVVETRQITVPLIGRNRSADIFLSGDIPGGYGWLFPKCGVANLGAGVAPQYKADLKRIVARLHDELAASGRVGDAVIGLTGGLIPVGGMLRPWGMIEGTCVLLAGDAAGLANPITGAGIAAAVHSGRLAGEAAAASIGGNVGACEEYEDELESVFRPSLDRALRRRRELAALCRAGSRPNKAALRRGWIAYPEYWSSQPDPIGRAWEFAGVSPANS